jgi:hypothetical protein
MAVMNATGWTRTCKYIVIGAGAGYVLLLFILGALPWILDFKQEDPTDYAVFLAQYSLLAAPVGMLIALFLLLVRTTTSSIIKTLAILAVGGISGFALPFLVMSADILQHLSFSGGHDEMPGAVALYFVALWFLPAIPIGAGAAVLLWWLHKALYWTFSKLLGSSRLPQDGSSKIETPHRNDNVPEQEHRSRV